MDGLAQAIQRCNLRLKLDNPTEGQGNCFPNAIVQQCRRPEVKAWLKEQNPDALFNGQYWVRKKVTTFAVQSRHETIIKLKIMYEAELQMSMKNHGYNTGETWPMMELGLATCLFK